jgi:hypothetical protein
MISSDPNFGLFYDIDEDDIGDNYDDDAYDDDCDEYE